jgi:glycerol-3-phosphate dehydrogenase
MTRKKARQLFPSLRKESLIGAIRYYDGQLDDARHTMMLARTAQRYGAVCVPSARVTGFCREGDRVTGVVVSDLEGGGEVEVKARQTINATGVWTDDIQQLVGGRGQLSVRASKGIHLVVPRDRINATVGLISRTATSVLFVIPWEDHWIIGTTDSDWNLDLAHPAASRSDIDYLLEQANRLLSTPLTHEDIQGVYAGLRPLLSGEHEETSQLSREHAISRTPRGMVSVAGGKYTTYRVMAKDAVDAALHSLGVAAPSSVTDRIPVVGAEGFPALWNARQRLADESGLHIARIEHLLHRYGTLVHELLQLVAEEPGLGEPLAGAPEYLRVEMRYGASHEGALHLDDLLARRTRVSIETFDRGLAAAPEVARIVAPVLGWTDQDIDREVEHYTARVAAERESQAQPDDQTADAARVGAPDVRMGAKRA